MTGTAVQWRFCYYVQYSVKDQKAWLRKTGSESYRRETEDIITQLYTDITNLGDYGAECEGDPPYCCETLKVSHSIDKNDIIGVCMRDAGQYDPRTRWKCYQLQGLSIFRHK